MTSETKVKAGMADMEARFAEIEREMAEADRKLLESIEFHKGALTAIVKAM